MPNLSDVARKAEVSVSTVSAVLRGKHAAIGITDLCALRVRQAAQEVGYVPNYHARSMRLGRAHVIGLAMQIPGISETGSLYFSAISGGIHAAIQEAGYNLMLIRSTPQTSAVDRGVMGIRQRMLDGLVIPGQASTLRHGQPLTGQDVQNLPAVVLDPAFTTDLPAVVLDEPAGVRLAVEHLAQLGHRRLLWLGPDQWSDNPVASREQSFIQAAWDAGLRGASCRYPDHRSSNRLANARRTADEALSAWLAEERGFTAVVCYNDIVAIGALQALQRAGLRVPEDISVVGFDDGAIAQAAMPSLTTVNHRLADLGLQAGRMVMELIEADPSTRTELQGHRHVVTPTLTVRQSTAKANPQ